MDVVKEGKMTCGRFVAGWILATAIMMTTAESPVDVNLEETGGVVCSLSFCV